MVGDSREDWRIISAVSEVAGKPLPYDTVAGVRQRLADVAPHLAKVDAVESPLWLNGEYNKVPAVSHWSSLCDMAANSCGGGGGGNRV